MHPDVIPAWLILFGHRKDKAGYLIAIHFPFLKPTNPAKAGITILYYNWIIWHPGTPWPLPVTIVFTMHTKQRPRFLATSILPNTKHLSSALQHPKVIDDKHILGTFDNDLPSFYLTLLFRLEGHLQTQCY